MSDHFTPRQPLYVCCLQYQFFFMLVQEEDVVKLCDTQSFNFLCKVIEIAALLREITKPLLLFTLCTNSSLAYHKCDEKFSSNHSPSISMRFALFWFKITNNSRWSDFLPTIQQSDIVFTNVSPSSWKLKIEQNH